MSSLRRLLPISLWTALLAGCDPVSDPAAPVGVAAVERLIGPGVVIPGFEVHTDALIPGGDTFALATGVPQGERVFFFVGSQLQRPAPGCGGVGCLPLQAPVFLGSADANADRVAARQIQVPPNLPAGDAFLLAIVIRGAQFSAAAVERYQVGAPPSCRGDGMTWLHRTHDPAFGVDLVGCGTTCDAYAGDTPCTASRPILCVTNLNLPNPGVQADFYSGWVGGFVDETMPVSGCLARSIDEVNAICEAELGPGYIMAEHHEGGGGWNWWAYGNLTSPRFWAWVDDQDSACFPNP
jgi:hypothetical protein